MSRARQPEARDGVHARDAALLTRVANGEGEALAALYDRYAGLLMALGLRIMGDRRDAEDLVHEVFLEAWKRAGDYDPARGTVRTWLLIRMRSRCLDRRKASGVRQRVPLAEEAALMDSAVDLSDAPDRARVRAALAELPVEQRRVIVLGYFEGLSSSEIAKHVGVPIGTVKSRVAAGLCKLRRGLDEAEGRP